MSEVEPVFKDKKDNTISPVLQIGVTAATTIAVSTSCNASFEAIAKEFSKKIGEVADE